VKLDELHQLDLSDHHGQVSRLEIVDVKKMDDQMKKVLKKAGQMMDAKKDDH
jgi:hypothetical protein